MATSIGEIEATLRLRDELTAQLAKASGAVRTFGTDAESMGKGLKAAGDRIGSLGTSLTVGLTVPIAAAFATVVKSASDFDTAFANVRKTVGNQPELPKIREEIRGLSRELPQTASELANFAALGGQFGISAGGITTFTKTVAALQVAVDGISAEQAAEGLAQIRNITGESEEKISNMAAALVGLGNAGASSEGQILDFAQRLSGIGVTIGLTTPEIFGLGATLANLGINAELGSTAIQKTIVEMQKAVSAGGDGLRQFAAVAAQGGIAADQFATAFRERPIEAIGAFIKGLTQIKASGGDLVTVLSTMDVEAQRQLSTLLQMAAASGRVGSAQGDLGTNITLVNRLWEQNSAHLDEAAEKNKTFANQLSNLRNVLADALLPIGDDLIEALKGIINGFKGLVPVIEPVVKAFVALPDSVKLATFGFLALLAIAGPFLWWVSTIVRGIGDVVLAINGLKHAWELFAATRIGTTLTTMASGIGLTGTAAAGATISIGAYAAALWLLIQRLREAKQELGTGPGTISTLGGGLGALPFVGPLLSGVQGNAARASGRSTRLATKAPEMFRGQTAAQLGGVNIVEEPSAPPPSAGPFLGAGAGSEKASDFLKDHAEKMKELTAQIKLAEQNQVSLNLQIEMFGSQAVDAANKGVAFGQTVSAEIDKLAQATVIDKAMSELTKQAKDMSEEILKDQSAFIEKSVKVANQAWTGNVSEQLKASEDLFNVQQKMEGDSLESRLAVISRDADKRRSLLDKNASNYEESLAEINALEAASAELATQEWNQHIAEVKASMNTYPNIFRNVLKDIPGILQDAFTGGGDLLGGIKGILSNLGSGLGGRLFTDIAAKSSNFLFSTFGVGVTETLGAIIPGLGAAIGALAGPLIGKIAGMFNKPEWKKVMSDVGRDWGVDISEGLAKQIAEDSKKIGRLDAPLLHLGDIFKEAGGIEAFGLDEAIKKTRQLFEAMDRGSIDAKDATKALNDVFPELAETVLKSNGLASASFLELITLTQRFGVESAAVVDFLAAQGEKVVSGFNKIAEGFTGLFGGDAEEGGPGFLTFLETQLPNIGILAQATFATLLANGMSVIEALAQMGPGLDNISAQLERAGLAAPAAFGDLLQLQGIVEQHRDLFNVLAGVDEMLVGLHNSGMLTQESFLALAGIVTSSFNTLTAGGVAADQALRLMQPQLQRLWELSTQFGLSVDEGTQALIDQAVAQGIVGPQMQDINKQMLDVLLLIAEALGATIPEAMRGLPSAAQQAADGMNAAFSDVRIQPVLDDANLPDWLREAIERGRGGTVGELPEAAQGAYVPSRPGGTPVLVGEGGEDEIIAPLSRLGGMSVVVNVYGTVIEEQDLARTVTDAVIENVLANEGGAFTRMNAALGLT